MSEAPDQVPGGPTDAQLIAAVRRGDTTAFGVLYQRHLHAAARAARCLAGTEAEREDLVAEAFTKVLQVMRAGGGPDVGFRAYLLTTMRHLAINASRRAPATALFADLPESFLPDGGDPVAARMSGNDAAIAFAGLPERWRVVLWHTEIEGESPAAVAPLLGMTPNSVSALAYRAREGLRLAYLRQHLPAMGNAECRATTVKLASWVRGSISAPQRHKVNAHLARCPRCRELADGLEQLNGELPAILAPALLGASFAAAYLKGASAAASCGLATVSWLSAVKASISVTAAQAGAAAAIAAVTAVTVISGSAPPPESGRQFAADGTAGPVPRQAVDTAGGSGSAPPAANGPILHGPIPAGVALPPPPATGTTGTTGTKSQSEARKPARPEPPTPAVAARAGTGNRVPARTAAAPDTSDARVHTAPDPGRPARSAPSRLSRR